MTRYRIATPDGPTDYTTDTDIEATIIRHGYDPDLAEEVGEHPWEVKWEGGSTFVRMIVLSSAPFTLLAWEEEPS